MKSIRRRQDTAGDISEEAVCQVAPKEVYETDEQESDTGFILAMLILLVTGITSSISCGKMSWDLKHFEIECKCRNEL